MASKDLHVNLWDLVSPVARTVDLMSPAVAEHHMRVAYLALRLSEALGLPPEERRDITLAAALHDIGAFSLNERLDLLAFLDNALVAVLTRCFDEVNQVRAKAQTQAQQEYKEFRADLT